MTNELDNEKLNRSLMEHMVLGVAHEINNPNTFVRLNAMTLKKMLGMMASNHPNALDTKTSCEKYSLAITLTHSATVHCASKKYATATFCLLKHL